MSKRKIGFIDYFIDEWHANNYPKMIADSSLGDQFEVALAWEQLDPPPAGKRPIGQWCKELGIPQAASQGQVIDECDCIVILSPDNGEQHEQLADKALRSGKPVYIDKPFSLDVASAKRIVALAAEHNTPMFSSSALRFEPTLVEALEGPLANKKPSFVSTRSAGVFPIYGIHHLEMIHMAMRSPAKRIMQVGNGDVSQCVIDFGDNRRAVAANVPGCGFELLATYHNDEGAAVSLHLNQMQDFFARFIDGMLTFFDTGKAPIDPSQTLEIVATLEAGIKALDTPDQWVDVANV